MKLFILAGGKGTRLSPYTDIIPKCLVHIAGKPCVRWIIEDAIDQGFDDIVLCINKKDELSYRHEFRDIDLTYSVSEEPIGTVGEVLCAKRFIDDTFILRYGDDLTEIYYEGMVNFHKAREAAATLALTTQVPLEIGLADVKGDEIIKMREKPVIGQPAWTAIAVLEPQVISYFKYGEDIATNVIPKMLDAGEKICAYITNELWLDVGNIRHLRRADKYFREKLKGEMVCLQYLI